MALYYVDFENVHTGGLNGIEELCRKDEVYIYCRETDVKRIESILKKKNIRASVKCKIVDGVTKNALDFELIADLFESDYDGVKYIVSNDKGYDAAIHRGMRNSNLIFRRTSIKENTFETFFEEFGEGCREVVIQ